MAALLLIGIPQKAEPPLPDLYTAQEAQYPLFASLSFLCFAKEAHTLSCEGEVLKRKAGKAAKGEALLWGYESGLSKEVALAQRAENAQEKSPAKEEIIALLVAYRRGDAQAKQTLSEAISLVGQASSAPSEPLPAPLATVCAQADGYFSPDCDGFECFDGADPLSFTVEQVLHFKEKQDTPAQGKLYTSQSWYALAVVEAEVAAQFAQGKSYEVPYLWGQVLRATLSAIRTAGAQSLLVFAFYGIPKGGIARTFTANVAHTTLSGMRIPKSAIFEDGGVFFVRVYAGEAVWLRTVEIVAHSGRCVFAKGGKSIEYKGKKRYPLKAGESIYINYEAKET
ncbi:MAG: hypothetical protein J6R40_06605 [Clostridia bacterium]|nr:hypothetical protein [Clostridia bacterium]